MTSWDKTYSSKSKVIFTLFLILSVHIGNSILHAQEKTFYATCRKIVGDNETKAQARKECLYSAVRDCIEQAGIYIESYTTIKNNKLEKDEIKTYFASNAKIKIVGEKTQIVKNYLELIIKVELKIDIKKVEQFLNELQKVKLENLRVKEENSELEERIENLEKITKEKKKENKGTPRIISNYHRYRNKSYYHSPGFISFGLEFYDEAKILSAAVHDLVNDFYIGISFGILKNVATYRTDFYGTEKSCDFWCYGFTAGIIPLEFGRFVIGTSLSYHYWYLSYPHLGYQERNFSENEFSNDYYYKYYKGNNLGVSLNFNLFLLDSWNLWLIYKPTFNLNKTLLHGIEIGVSL